MSQRVQRTRAPKLGYHLRDRPHKGENLAHCRHWQIVYEITGDNRQQSYEAFEGSKAEAHARAQSLLADRRAGNRDATPAPPLLRTFADVAEEWISEHLAHLEPKTLGTCSPAGDVVNPTPLGQIRPYRTTTRMTPCSATPIHPTGLGAPPMTRRTVCVTEREPAYPTAVPNRPVHPPA